MMTQGELTTWWEALRVWWQSQDPEELGAALLGVRAADREAVLAEVSYDGLRARGEAAPGANGGAGAGGGSSKTDVISAA